MLKLGDSICKLFAAMFLYSDLLPVVINPVISAQAYVLPQEGGRDGDLVTCVKWKPDATKHIVAGRYGSTKVIQAKR